MEEIKLARYKEVIQQEAVLKEEVQRCETQLCWHLAGSC